LIVNVVAFATDHVSVVDCPEVMVVGAAEKLAIVGAGVPVGGGDTGGAGGLGR
jgi:hypothetical protein